MASGKKGKKSKGKTLNLNDFLADESAAPAPGQAVIMAPRKAMSWADEVENEDESSMYESRKERVVLPTAPRAARGNDVDEDRVPHQPPFLAYMSNLPYDLEEEDLLAFFGKLKIMKVRLPKDDRESGRLKGFGYVEFEERADLKEALGMSDSSLKNRRVRIEVSDNDGRRGGGRDRDNSDRPMTDWRSGPRDEGRERDDDRGGGFGRREYGGGGGFGRDRDSRDGNRGGFGGERSERPAGPWERNRGGPEPERERFGGGDRDRGFGGDRYGGDRDRGGFDRDRGGGFGNDRYEGRGGGGYGSDRYGDRRGGGGGGGGGGGMSNFSRRGYGDENRYSRDDRPERESEVPKERPKLNLAPRSKPPPEEVADSSEPSGPAPAPASSSSIFGGAKPVDTLARELEIEERLDKLKAAPAPKEGEGEPAPAAPAPAQTSWRSERQQQPPSQQRTNSRDRRDEDGGPPRRGDSNEGRYAPPIGKEGGSENRYQPPRGNYQPRQGHSPDRRGERPAQQRSAGPRSGDRPSRSERPEDRSAPRKEDRPPRRELSDDAIRMPKLEEKKGPDFIGSNPYAALPDEEDVECD